MDKSSLHPLAAAIDADRRRQTPPEVTFFDCSAVSPPVTVNVTIDNRKIAEAITRYAVRGLSVN